MSVRPLRLREPFAYIEHRNVTVRDGAIVAEGVDHDPTPVPAESLVAIMLGPGCTVSSAAVSLMAKVQTALVHVGENGVRFYGSGRPFGSDGDVAEQHARRWAHDSESARRLLFSKRWGKDPTGVTAAEMRGEEGVMVRSMYRQLADEYGVKWDGRKRTDFSGGDNINDALSWCGVSVGAISAAVVHAIGAIPALGFIHSGGSFSFVYDGADLIRNDTIRLAFSLVSENRAGARDVRLACRDYFREARTSERLIADLLEVIGMIAPKT